MTENVSNEHERDIEEIADLAGEDGTGSEVQLAIGNYFEEILDDVFQQKREFLIQVIREKLAGSQHPSQREDVVENSADWTEIASLSRLRSVVGGRFQNLKTRWVAAGFPLREHRGDQGGDYTVEEEGWLELSNWVASQGFEARLASSGSQHLFEVRKRE